jgi:hypothetical protein
MPAVGRDRLTRGGLAHDAPGLPGPVRALSQLPDPLARLAGKGARTRTPPDAVPVSLAPLPDPVRRDPAARGPCPLRFEW